MSAWSWRSEPVPVLTYHLLLKESFSKSGPNVSCSFIRVQHRWSWKDASPLSRPSRAAALKPELNESTTWSMWNTPDSDSSAVLQAHTEQEWLLEVFIVINWCSVWEYTFLIQTEKKSTDASFACIIFFLFLLKTYEGITETIKWAKGNVVFVGYPPAQSTIFIILFVSKSFILNVLFFKTMFFD